MPTLRDVAKAAGVSATTVSQVLKGSKRVSPEVSERVRATAHQLGYRPNRSARALRTGRTGSLGLIVPDLANPFFPELAQAIVREARSQGFAVSLVDALEDPHAEEEGIILLEEQRVDGAIWVPLGGFHPLPFPVVLVDRLAPGQDGVGSDHAAGGSLQARLATTLGHRRVALITGPAALESARLRAKGFLDLAGAEMEIVWVAEAPFSEELPQEVCDRLQAGGFSLVACGNDLIALGVLRVLQARGIAVPEQVSVVGYDDIPLAGVTHPPLTTVRQPLRQMGQEALRLLLRRIDHPQAPPVQVRLPVELVRRGSTREVLG
ncbi:MAG: LacI family DNA-binding transcriptional regulator [Deinococcota bacterium]